MIPSRSIQPPLSIDVTIATSRVQGALAELDRHPPVFAPDAIEVSSGSQISEWLRTEFRDLLDDAVVDGEDEVFDAAQTQTGKALAVALINESSYHRAVIRDQLLTAQAMLKTKPRHADVRVVRDTDERTTFEYGYRLSDRSQHAALAYLWDAQHPPLRDSLPALRELIARAPQKLRRDDDILAAITSLTRRARDASALEPEAAMREVRDDLHRCAHRILGRAARRIAFMKTAAPYPGQSLSERLRDIERILRFALRNGSGASRADVLVGLAHHFPSDARPAHLIAFTYDIARVCSDYHCSEPLAIIVNMLAVPKLNTLATRRALRTVAAGIGDDNVASDLLARIDAAVPPSRLCAALADFGGALASCGLQSIRHFAAIVGPSVILTERMMGD